MVVAQLAEHTSTWLINNAVHAFYFASDHALLQRLVLIENVRAQNLESADGA